MNAVASGFGADVVHGIAGAGGRCLHDLFCLCNAEAEDVDQRVASVALVERNLAADGWNSDAVAVPGDPGHDTGKRAPNQRVVERPETQ